MSLGRVLLGGFLFVAAVFGVSYLLKEVWDVLPGDVWGPTIAAASAYIGLVVAQRLFKRRR
jgi:hypothetical protein